MVTRNAGARGDIAIPTVRAAELAVATKDEVFV